MLLVEGWKWRSFHLGMVRVASSLEAPIFTVAVAELLLLLHGLRSSNKINGTADMNCY